MKETSTIGFEYIAEKMHEQQLQLDSALMRSIQETPGMRGEALPYQFRSEWSVTCLLLFGIQVACQMTFTALGNAKCSTFVAVLRKFILLIPLMYVLPHIWTSDQTMAVFLAEPIADFLSVTFTVILFQHVFRKVLKSL